MGSSSRTKGPIYFCIAFLPVPGKAPPEVAAIAEACLRFTPDLTLRQGDRPALFLETARCQALYSPESLEARLRLLLRDFGVAPGAYRIARASSLPKAWLCANHALTEGEIAGAPIAAIEDLIDPLGHRVDDRRRIVAMVEVLFVLGIRRIGAIRKLPPDSAVSRFGGLYEKLLEVLLEAVAPNTTSGGTADFPWERFRPGEKFLERIDLPPDDPVWDLEPTLFHAKSLLDRILKRAFGRGKALVALEFRIECERKRNSREVFAAIPLRFTFPQTAAPIVLRALREKLAHEFNRRELEAPIAAYELEAVELTPRSGMQTSFLEGGEEASVREGFRDLVTELGTKLVVEKELFQAELRAAWRPERSWQKVLKDPSELKVLSLPIPVRPLRLFSPPESLRRLGRYFIWNDKRYRIREFAQIERLSGEWWAEDGGFTRTYYRVRVEAVSALEAPREFWIFREQTNAAGEGGLFLHGLF